MTSRSFVPEESVAVSKEAAVPTIVVRFDRPIAAAGVLRDQAALRLASAFPDLGLDARLIALASDPGAAILRLAADPITSPKPCLTITAARSLLSPFDLALVCRVLVDVALGRDGAPLPPAPEFAAAVHPGCSSYDFGYPAASGVRAETVIADQFDPDAIGIAVAQAVAIWTGQDRAALAVLNGNAAGRAVPHLCNSDGSAVPMRGTAEGADFLCCIETKYDELDPVFRAALFGGKVEVAHGEIAIQSAALVRPDTALTVLARADGRNTALSVFSGRKGLPVPLVDWFLRDVAALLSGTDPQDRDALPSIRNRRASQGPTRIPKAELAERIDTLWTGVEAACRAYPERIALRDGDRVIDYATLRLQTRAVCAALASDNRPIGLLFEHGCGMVMAMLAALAAGRTYVPLDPDYPRARLAHMLEASRVSQLLCDPALGALARDIAPAGCAIMPSGDMADIEAPPPASRPTAPDDTAYILFTSGSTGTPKRVAPSHRNVLMQIRNHVAALSITPRDRVSVVSSFCFDASVTDTYGALLTGATLVPASARRLGLVDVARTVRDQQVSVWHSTPTAFRHMLGGLKEAPGFPHLRAVLLGGETVFAHDVQAAARHCAADVLFVNGYGATEASFITQNPVTASEFQHGDIVPIGWPIPGFTVDLADESGRPTPVCGEMIVTSAHYTTEATVPDSSDHHATKDLARFDPHSGFTHIGRKGAQIKLRGYRIDLAEIEQILARQPGIGDVCVAIRPDPRQSGSDVLCAWLEVQGRKPRKATLAQAVLAQLPAFMVPTYYTLLPSLPLTQSGKIDRRQMPDPDTAPDPGTAVSSSAPLNQALEELFGLRCYDPDLSFFELGLTSLSLAQLHANLAKHTGTKLSLVDFFDLGTPAKLAARLAAAADGGMDLAADDDSVTSIRARLKKRKQKRAP